MHLYKSHNNYGFTLVELLIASVVVSTALTGIYALFRHAMDVEAKIALKWNEQDAAMTILDHLSEAITDVINLPNTKSIYLSSNSEGGVLICQTVTQRRRYRWYRKEEETNFTLELQTIHFSGEKSISLGVDWMGEDSQGVWENVAVTIIGQKIQSISLSCCSLKENSCNWKNNWNDMSGKVAFRLEIGVGSQVVSRTVVPKANAEVNS